MRKFKHPPSLAHLATTAVAVAGNEDTLNLFFENAGLSDKPQSTAAKPEPVGVVQDRAYGLTKHMALHSSRTMRHLDTTMLVQGGAGRTPASCAAA